MRAAVFILGDTALACSSSHTGPGFHPQYYTDPKTCTTTGFQGAQDSHKMSSKRKPIVDGSVQWEMSLPVLMGSASNPQHLTYSHSRKELVEWYVPTVPWLRRDTK